MLGKAEDLKNSGDNELSDGVRALSAARTVRVLKKDAKDHIKQRDPTNYDVWCLPSVGPRIQNVRPPKHLK